MKINGRIGLNDIRPLSQSEFETARRTCEEIEACRERRDDYIREHSLDPEVALPAANWSEDAATTN